MNQFVKILNQESTAFKFLLRFLPKLSEVKIIFTIFVGPQIKKSFKSTEFISKLSWVKNRLDFFKVVVDGSLGNYRAKNYQQLI